MRQLCQLLTKSNGRIQKNAKVITDSIIFILNLHTYNICVHF